MRPRITAVTKVNLRPINKDYLDDLAHNQIETTTMILFQPPFIESNPLLRPREIREITTLDLSKHKQDNALDI